ncbi:MAG: nitrite/sulfite reductase [Ardenticatenaceae bacterium]|nr:nitrite/sulfite reductase [Ardenticatenaceae bacterium]
MSEQTEWKEKLKGQIEPLLEQEIDLFESQIELKRQGKLDEKVFGETRLRRGVYGQRYDNGQRHDGRELRTLHFPSGSLTKGTDTVWDAPGMQRIKIPYGGLTPDQLVVMAQLAEEYSDAILHVTTRQDIQLHFVHLEDTPDLMRRLGAVGITTREACGNSVRNITGCPLAGVCRTEAFDVTPYADALTWFLMGHDDIQDFGRKFKIAFSGCAHEACGLVKMHDLGYVARAEQVDGVAKRFFDVYVGGGLGTVPHQAKLLAERVPEEELLPQAQAVARVFARLGEKKNRNRARLKFLVAKLGIEEFQRLVTEERKHLPYDPRWTAYLDELTHLDEAPLKPPSFLNGASFPDGFDAWYATNVYFQRQAGYTTVTVNLPLGDISSRQAYALANIARRYVGESIRTTVEQNLVLRWVSESDLISLYHELRSIGLADPGAGTVTDITSCPGTDTCKLGIAASRGLAGELRQRLIAQSGSLHPAVEKLKIKISGCFNSCGQHHVADIGFFGNSRRKENRAVPHFQVVLGGQWQQNGGSYGLAIGAVPAKNIPAVFEAITARYVADRDGEETFQSWTGRLGKKEIRAIIQPFMNVPLFAENPAYFSDWGDPRPYSLADIGIGECAGEVVSLFSIEVARAEGEAFDALVALDENRFQEAAERAYSAMVLAARALIRNEFIDIGDDSNRIVQEFKTRFVDTQRFYDKYAKGKFAQYLLEAHHAQPLLANADVAHRLVEEANLFIEAAHACDARLAAAAAPAVPDLLKGLKGK